MNWKKVTLSHYQQIYPILKSDLEGWEKDLQVVSILYNLTDAEIDELPISHYHRLRDAASFIYTEIPKGNTPKYIKGRKRTYKVNYQIEQIPFARYAEVKHFSGSEEDYFKNLHLLMASMVTPVGLLKRKLKYNSDEHLDYAEDLQFAPFADIYHASVFFCHLYRNLIYASPAYLVDLFQSTMTPSQAKSLYLDLCSSLDGFITASRLPSLKASLYRRLGICPPSEPLTPSTI
jgi:hypothetical protein